MAPSEIASVGRYGLLERLHLGEKSETFLARRNEGQDGWVALKRLLPEASADEALVASFQLVAQLAAPIGHSAVCRVEDFGSLEGVHFLAREYVGGKDLRDLQRRHVLQHRLIPDGLVVFIAAQLCEGLVAIRQSGEQGEAASPKLYGDVDLRHVLISFAGDVKLIGFGLRANGSPDGAAQELRQWGATVYELLTGKAPSAGGEGPGAVPPPHQLRQTVTPELSELVMRALGVGPTFSGVAELKQALDGCAIPPEGSATELGALMKRTFAGALRIEKERVRRVTQAELPAARGEETHGPRSVSAQASALAGPATPGEGASSPVPGPRRTTPGETVPLETAQVATEASRVGRRARGGLFGYAVLAAGVFTLLGGAAFYATSAPNHSSDRPAGQVGQIEVSSEVPVDIFLNADKVKLSAPLSRALPPGPHDLAFQFRGTERRLERRIEIKSGETVMVNLTRGTGPRAR